MALTTALLPSLCLSDMMGVGCELNGASYNNGQAFQPSPLYKCTCIDGAIGCTPAFVQKPAGLLGPAPLRAGPPGSLQNVKKHQQDTTYRAVPGVCLLRELEARIDCMRCQKCSLQRMCTGVERACGVWGVGWGVNVGREGLRFFKLPSRVTELRLWKVHYSSPFTFVLTLS